MCLCDWRKNIHNMDGGGEPNGIGIESKFEIRLEEDESLTRNLLAQSLLMMTTMKMEHQMQEVLFFAVSNACQTNKLATNAKYSRFFGIDRA